MHARFDGSSDSMVVPPMTGQRTNASWLEDLGSPGLAREKALADLTAYLRAGLRRSLGSDGNAQGADVEDFTQEALLRILDALDSFRGESRFTTWAMTIALRVAYTALRKRRFADVSLDEIEGYGNVLDANAWRGMNATDNSAEKRDLLDTLQRAIAEQLTERQRTVILAELQGVASGRVAELLGSNRNAVYKVYHDSRKKLQSALVEAGFTKRDVAAILEEAQ